MSCVLQLSINAFDYNCHVDLIKLLKQEGELFSLRKARQRMSELFPLTEGWCMCDEVVDDATWKYFPSKSPFLSCSAEIWLDWLKDEIHLSEEEPNREKLYELFERAVKDYICECLFHGHQICLVWPLRFCHYWMCFCHFRSRYLARICSIFHWWHGVTRWDWQGEIHLWESCDSCRAPYDQGTDGLGGVQRVRECHLFHITGLLFICITCFHYWSMRAYMKANFWKEARLRHRVKSKL